MADENSKGGIGALSGLDPAITSQPKTEVRKKNDELGKTEFLQLLVTQLKNQDPLDPMKSEEFAVNLAQFSQLEQLISINDKVGAGSGAGDLSSLASYLGTQVALNSDQIDVENGDGGIIRVDLGKDASGVKIELLDGDGKVKGTSEVGELKAGKHTIALPDLDLANGSYQLKITAVSTTGGEFAPKATAAGIVSGFIPGADPKLIVGRREVSPSEITEVTLPPQGA